jgi:hypothetical protein
MRVSLRTFVLHCINYPVIKGFSIGTVCLTAFLASASHVFIDIRFEPYGFAYYPDLVKIVLSLMYGFVLGVGIKILHTLIANQDKYWEVWKEILWYLAVILSITSLNFIVRGFTLRVIFDLKDLYPISYSRFLLIGAEVVGITIIVFKFIQLGLIKVQALMVANVEMKHSEIDNSQDERETNNSVIIRGKNKNQTIKLNLNDFVYAESSGNYLRLFLKEQNSHKFAKIVIRLSLKDFERQLGHQPDIRRVHKSFIVNFNVPFNLSGNSKKAYLIFQNNEQIPVSRAFYNAGRSEINPI